MDRLALPPRGMLTHILMKLEMQEHAPGLSGDRKPRRAPLPHDSVQSGSSHHCSSVHALLALYSHQVNQLVVTRGCTHSVM